VNLSSQKRLAAELLKCGVTRVRFDPERLDEVESAITREDVRKLIKDGVIYKVGEIGVSRARVRVRTGKRGPGSREGSKYSIVPRKRNWILRVRAQRRFLKKLRDAGVIERRDYRILYRYVKAGNFKSISALKEFMKLRGLLREGVR